MAEPQEDDDSTSDDSTRSDDSVYMDTSLHFSAFASTLSEAPANGHDIQEVADHMFVSHTAWETLSVSDPLQGSDLEEEIFRMVLSHERIKELSISEGVNTAVLIPLLQRTISDTTNIEHISLIDLPMNAKEAEDIFEIMGRCASIKDFSFFMLTDYDDGVFAAFCRFIRESVSLRRLQLVADRPGEEGLSLSVFQSICNALNESSLERLDIDDLIRRRGEELDTAIQTLANWAVTRPSLKEIVYDPYARGIAGKRLRRALNGTEPAQKFDVCIRQRHVPNRGLDPIIDICRNCCWRRLLSQEVPLNYWPKILAKSNQCTSLSSNGKIAGHKPRDVVYFLLKEKNGVLLQNVKKRRIRKRKRFQFES